MSLLLQMAIVPVHTLYTKFFTTSQGRMHDECARRNLPRVLGPAGQATHLRSTGNPCIPAVQGTHTHALCRHMSVSNSATCTVRHAGLSTPAPGYNSTPHNIWPHQPEGTGTTQQNISSLRAQCLPLPPDSTRPHSRVNGGLLADF